MGIGGSFYQYDESAMLEGYVNGTELMKPEKWPKLFVRISGCICKMKADICVPKITRNGDTYYLTYLIVPEGTIVHLGPAFESEKAVLKSRLLHDYACRSSHARVELQSTLYEGSPMSKETSSLFVKDFKYQTGDTVKSRAKFDPYDDSNYGGIHWYATIEQAIGWKKLFHYMRTNGMYMGLKE